MGLLNHVRVTQVIRKASVLIDKNLRVQQHVAGRTVPQSAGRSMVLALWHNRPELAARRTMPNPALLAAAALAHAIRICERAQDYLMADAFHRTLSTLWLADRDFSVLLQQMSESDGELFEQANSVLRTPWIGKS